MVINPVLGGKGVKADSIEGIAIRQAAIDERIKKVLFFGDSLNSDGSIKTNKGAQAIATYGVSTYTDDNGKLFIGSKPAPVDVNAGKTPDKPLPVPTSAQALKTGTYYATQKGVALWTGEKFDDNPAAGAPAAVAPAAGAPVTAPFATKPPTTIEKIQSEKTDVLKPMVQEFKKAEQDYIAAIKAGRQGDVSSLMQTKESLRKQIKDKAMASFGEQQTPKILSTLGM
jgi:hypothetical protein